MGKQPHAEPGGNKMVEQGGGENAGGNGVAVGKTRGEKEGEQLGFVADFGNKHAQRGRKKGVHQAKSEPCGQTKKTHRLSRTEQPVCL